MPLEMVRVDERRQRAALQRTQRHDGAAAAEPSELARALQRLARFVPVLQCMYSAPVTDTRPYTRTVLPLHSVHASTNTTHSEFRLAFQVA